MLLLSVITTYVTLDSRIVLVLKSQRQTIQCEPTDKVYQNVHKFGTSVNQTDKMQPKLFTNFGTSVNQLIKCNQNIHNFWRKYI